MTVVMAVRAGLVGMSEAQWEAAAVAPEEEVMAEAVASVEVAEGAEGSAQASA